MFRKDSQLTVLQARKKLLVAESEVNRAELAKDVGTLKMEIARLKKHVKTVGSIASSAALLATAVSIFRGEFRSREGADGHAKRSWISTALAGARLGTSLFLKIKSLFHERERE